MKDFDTPMTTDVQQGPLEPVNEINAPARKSGRELRWERRRRRLWFEEILGWILVPVILLAGYWIIVALLEAIGTSPAAIINGLQTIKQAL